MEEIRRKLCNDRELGLRNTVRDINPPPQDPNVTRHFEEDWLATIYSKQISIRNIYSYQPHFQGFHVVQYCGVIIKYLWMLPIAILPSTTYHLTYMKYRRMEIPPAGTSRLGACGLRPHRIITTFKYTSVL